MSDEMTQPPENNRSEAKMREYRRAYWQRFHETRRRIYGTLSNVAYEQIEQRAKAAGRSVWQQIRDESDKYAKGDYLPPEEIAERIDDLIVQLRRIGNNLNQIAVEVNIHGELKHFGIFAQGLSELEQQMKDFTSKPWGTPYEEGTPNKEGVDGKNETDYEPNDT